jgi:hypothetical protein
MMTAVVALLLAASPELEEGRLHMAALRYKAAVTALTKVADDAQAPLAERVEAGDLLARAHLALGNTAKAEAAYEALLSLDPMAAEPKAAPKVVAAFRRAKERRFPPGTVLLERRARSAELVEVRVVNPWRLAVQVELMSATSGAFTGKPVELDAALVGIATLSPGSRYYVRCLGPDGKVLASAGSELEPFAGPPAPPPAPVATTTEPPKGEAPPPLPRTDRVPVSDAPAATTTTPRKGVLDQVLDPRVLPVSRSMPLGRVAGWALLVGGVVLALAGGGAIAWGLLDIDRAGRPVEYGLDPDDVILLRRSGEERVLLGGIGAGVGAALSIIGGVLLAVTGSSDADTTTAK